MSDFTEKIVIGSYFTAYNKTNKPEQLLLKDLENWLEPPAIRRNTSQKLNGDGDFYSGVVRYSSKVIGVTMQIDYPEDISIMGLLTNIRLIAQSANIIIPISRYSYTDGVETKREVMEVLPADDFNDDFPAIENGVEFTLRFYAPSPWKTVYLNGSTVAETNKRL